MRGVHGVTASIASNSVTVEYDETVTIVGALRQEIVACGYHCTGQIMPRHVCEPHRAPVGAAATTPMSPDMAREMGHGAGMNMQGMVRDMRNRFWVSLIFTVPIFPMKYHEIVTREAKTLILDWSGFRSLG